ncbi:hypothetical protein H2203_005998 [Taxawa tesnikishii (nom. ined.)]|nr:hypothetical protein H2203_005998 [Dothideales sp. JES 119]
MASKVCPVVGTTNTILPPSHPDFDMNAPDLVCPVTNASTAHHHNLSKHPGIPNASSKNLSDAESCPALKDVIHQPENEALDEGICPIVGPVSSILPPDHPSTAQSKDGDVCPITKATLGHHKGRCTSTRVLRRRRRMPCALLLVSMDRDTR